MPKKKRVGAIPKPKVGRGGNKPGRLNNTGKKRKQEREFDQRKIMQAHGSKEAKDVIRRKMRIQQYTRAVDEKAEVIRAYVTPEDRAKRAKTDAAFKVMMKERLHGGPRPAWSREKSDHGCGYDHYYCHDKCGDWKNAPPTADLFETARGKFWDYPESQEYCEVLHHLGRGLRGAGKSGEAVTKLQELMKLDPTDGVHARYSMLSALLDEGSLGEARNLLETFPDDTSASFCYGRALIEYIAFAVLGEEDATEEAANAALDAAIAANAHVAALIVDHAAFAQLVDPNVADTIDTAWDKKGEHGAGAKKMAGAWNPPLYTLGLGSAPAGFPGPPDPKRQGFRGLGRHRRPPLNRQL